MTHGESDHRADVRDGPERDAVGTLPSSLAARADEGLNRLGLRGEFGRDCLLAVCAALGSGGLLWLMLGFLAKAEGIGFPPAAPIVLTALACAQSLVLCVRRTSPVVCLAAVVLAQLVIIAVLPADVSFQGIAPFVAAYTCGIRLSARRLPWVLVAVTVVQSVCGTLVAGLLFPPVPRPRSVSQVLDPLPLDEPLVVGAGLLVSSVLTYVVAALVGAYVGTRRRYVELVRIRAAEAVRAQRDRAEGAIRAERARMARELHDIAAHHLSGMVVQAGAAERLIGRDDRAAREAAAWIRSQGRETLSSLRLVVGALRDPGENAPSTGDGLHHTGDPGARGAPVPGLAALDRLVAAERDLGTTIDVVRDGERYDLPPVADVTFYRVAQEALSTPGSTRLERGCASCCATVSRRSFWRSRTGRGPDPAPKGGGRRRPRAGWDCSVCGRGPSWSARSWRPGRSRRAGGASGWRFRSAGRPRRAEPGTRRGGVRIDQGDPRGRPVRCQGGFPGDPRTRGRHRGGRRVR
ncbi:sensor histidine kinase [Allosalinactinospora lopnorensis]|uniref:sensor histidine kinase n=1 Tax=Allosalinactinospora lopnorensis TaxID=1352348 RepID=UPI001EFF61A9|nr:histidine kinase [Allosalinactinospora lopnorensis]